MYSPDQTNADNVFPTTERSRLRRRHERGSHKHADVFAVLDACPLGHIGYTLDGTPYVTPTLHWRDGDRVYWHGSAASRFLRKIEGMPVCLTCSMLDGYVLARSAFNHSVNYRSAMVFGKARVVEDVGEKTKALRFFVEGLFPGRWEQLRPMKDQELKATSVLWMEIEEATAKVRNAPPGDPEDADVPVWAGIIPVRSMLADAEPLSGLEEGLALSAELDALIRSGRLR
ncbi:nitroimidazol reductase NimA-like FMN-containing flavoprotein (pyridoxamine 5'-phosphate oxidase superfamily) [Pararhizobium capsulatum DSM 1112]|uniref:Nitroimidazol reductase NimA-like FMN-containing flavoprotein (Pyridoxamine 5'-phosphate oxidase superfamily) n=1 Tax=Pararhizobium capsulatum DSM 1112 TaxID=1121113 RepID=A0ABU0BVW0_9HYPH|nr:pyridoxamine 5'-phosphate oxidase family protein [Pararhizobium capsulatum]MDQ0322398.1 nitroimidazol reductase NimA-like FMN-containing flavoprotein (pyridoxamine 5'-phosphate oxidase superfamily) [Pararhizobium capsulatum DSM 1112]